MLNRYATKLKPLQSLAMAKAITQRWCNWDSHQVELAWGS